jgi:AraC-like DNA-binding protein
VEAGQGFLIMPGEETFYQASQEDPWHYAWVGYRGRRAEMLTQTAGLDLFHRVFSCAEPDQAWQALETMRSDARTLRLSQLAAVGSLYRFFSLIAPAQDPDKPLSPAQQYCDKALWFLEGRYDRDVSIQETADFVGVSRSHLYRIMQEECGCSPKEMLARIRMRNAEKLLRETVLNLDEIAHRVGFCNGAQFGAAFRNMHGKTPGQFRREHKA